MVFLPDLRYEVLRQGKVRAWLVGVSPLKSGGPLVLTLMLEIVMDVDDSALQTLI